MMDVGDSITDIKGDHWIISGMSEDKQFLNLKGFSNHKEETYLSVFDIVFHEPRPRNVTWLFLARKDKEFKGMEAFRS